MKKINFLGDSITQGACASTIENTYVAKVGSLLNCQAINYGIGGTRIAKQIIPSAESIYDEDFNKRAKDMDKDADFVFIFGGTNDHGHGDAPLGDMNDISEYTFYGALKSLLTYLIDIYGKEKLCYILPLHKYDEDNPRGEGNKLVNGPILKEYVSAIIEVCNLYGVEYLDMSNVFQKPKERVTDRFYDGLHPNDFGHELIAKEIVKYLQNKNI